MKIRILALLPAFFAAVLLIGWASSPAAHAESAAPVAVCPAFSNNIHFGQQDAGASTDVDSLQHFLADKGYFDAAAIGTGHFGPLTLRAVEKFQAAQNVPATGFVGPLTRAAIAKMQTDCSPITEAARLYSLSPESGPVGTTVSIRGFGFSSSNTVLIDGMVAARDVPIASSVAIMCTTDSSCHGGINQTIIFTLPSTLSPNCPVGSVCPLYLRLITPGKVTITVRNDQNVSNGLDFTVTK
ncbi:MAG TPA: peptidoglycan-binding protein [Candidatus Paceibacterota bacterium]|nr:peptidoglycan-binding protein [Candidatus Paceibacterota bacterium]